MLSWWLQFFWTTVKSLFVHRFYRSSCLLRSGLPSRTRVRTDSSRFNGFCFCCEVLWSACLYVCRSVRSRISKTIPVHPHFTIFSILVTRGQGSVLLWWLYAICYVLQVFWITSFSYNAGNKPKSKTTRIFRPVCRWRHGGEVCRLRLHLVLFVIYQLLLRATD